MCSITDSDPPNQKKSNQKSPKNQNQGVNNQVRNKPSVIMHNNQRQRQKQKKIKILPQLQVSLIDKKKKLTHYCGDKNDLSELKEDLDKLTSFEAALISCFQNNLNPQQRMRIQVEDQVCQINELLMYPYRISYELLLEKRYLVYNMQNLLEIIQEKNENKGQIFRKYQICLSDLKTKFPELAKRISNAMQAVKDLKNLHQKRVIIEEVKEVSHKWVQKQSKLENIPKSQLALIKIQQINTIIFGTLQEHKQNIKDNQQISEHQIFIISLKNQIENLKNKISDKQTQQNTLRQKINIMEAQKNSQIQKKKQQINSLKDLSSKITKQNQQIKVEKSSRLQNIKDLQNQIIVQKQKNNILARQKLNLEDQNISLHSQTRFLNELLQKQRDSNNAYNQKKQLQVIQIAKQREQLKIMISDLQSQLKMIKLFPGDILQNRKKEKAFLIASIEKHMNKKIEKAKILYDSKKDYNVNYHQRIDGKQNLVLILQTKNALVAAYYSGKYIQGSYMSQQGLILSLTNQKYYRLNNLANNPKKNKKDAKPVYGMVYDKFFLIFGNAELRIKPGQKDRKVFSNFGISNSYFNSEGDNVSNLLFQGKTNEVQFIDYEIYQAVLSSENEQKLQKYTNQQMFIEKISERKQETIRFTEEVRLDPYQITAKNFEEKCNRQSEFIIQLNRQIDQLKSSKEEIKIQNQRLRLTMQQIQKQLIIAKKQVQYLNQNIKNKQGQIYSMKHKIQDYAKSASDNEQKCLQMISQLQKVKKIFSLQQQNKSQLRDQILSLQTQLNKLKQIQALKVQPQSQNNFAKIEQQKSEEIKVTDSLQQINLSEHSIIKSKLSQALTNCETYRLQKQNQTQKIQSLKRELQNQKAEYKQKNQEIQQLKKIKSSLQQQRDEVIRRIQNKKGEIQNLNQKILSLQNQNLRLKSNQQEIIRLKQRNQELQSLNQELQKKSRFRTQSFIQHLAHFNGEILEKKREQKKFLISSIQNHIKRSIQKTKILFDFKKDSKVPFHQRLDGRQNLVMVLQTQNALIAGYYSGKYIEGVSLTQEGLILSLNNKKYYRLNNLVNFPKKNKGDKKPSLGMVYDKFFLIFGNAQIRIKPGQPVPKVFSNFGVSNSYFNNQGDNLNALLCEGKTNEVPIVNYEIYEIIFSQIEYHSL